MKNFLIVSVVVVAGLVIVASPVAVISYFDHKTHSLVEGRAKELEIQKQIELQQVKADQRHSLYVARFGTDTVEQTERKAAHLFGGGMDDALYSKAVTEKWLYEHCKPEDKEYYWHGDQYGIACEHDPVLWEQFRHTIGGGPAQLQSEGVDINITVVLRIGR